MKFTLKWLKQWLKTEAKLEEIVERLNQIGLEVESVVNNAEIYNDFTLAKIIEVNKHPNAEKLQICKVDNGKEILQIICGASNAREEIEVVLAPIGAKIPSNNLVIKRAKIRGIESEGMLCSASELCLGKSDNNEGIIELSGSKAGQSFAEFYGLDDVIIEISITPNRGDCSGVLGIARDLAATGIGEFIELPRSQSFRNDGNNFKTIDIVMENNGALSAMELCHEYSYVLGKGLKNKFKSDAKYLKFLRSVGYESKGAIVDISNFIMFDTGRPNHIYDADKITGNNINIRIGKGGESFREIGGIVDRKIVGSPCVIADDEKILSLAGVIGGDDSKVNSDTTNILIELASFDPDSIARQRSQFLPALTEDTDASFRFRRGVDRENSEIVLQRMIELLQEECGGQFTEIKTIVNSRIDDKYIIFNLMDIEKISGVKIPHEICVKILTKLGFSIDLLDKNQPLIYNAKVPSWRILDINGSADLVEEILRVYNLDNINAQSLSYIFPKANKIEKIREISRIKLLHRGLTEVISWSFVNKELADIFREEYNLVEIENPISSEMSVMRPSIICSMIPIVKKNIARNILNFGVFEVGSIYSNDESSINKDINATKDVSSYGFDQIRMIAGLRIGYIEEKGVHSTGRLVDFFDIRDDVMSYIEEYGIGSDKCSISKDVSSYYHPNKAASININGKKIAYFGQLHPAVIKALDIDHDNIYCFEIFLDNVASVDLRKKRKKIFDFQHITRDFAFLVDKNLPAGELVQAIESLHIPEIEEIKIFDIYQGEGIEDNLKSIGLSIKIQPQTGTMTDHDIEQITNAIVQAISNEYSAKLRF